MANIQGFFSDPNDQFGEGTSNQWITTMETDQLNEESMLECSSTTNNIHEISYYLKPNIHDMKIKDDDTQAIVLKYRTNEDSLKPAKLYAYPDNPATFTVYRYPVNSTCASLSTQKCISNDINPAYQFVKGTL